MNRAYLLSHNSFIQMIPFIILGILGFYFSYHLITGERSVLTSYALDQKLASAQLIYEQLNTERFDIEGDVIRLRPNSLDLDFVEERAHHMLGMGTDGDIAVSKSK